MFIGREKELAELERLYGSDQFHLNLVYGRRHIGKTALLTEFSRKKDCIFFTAMETNGKQNLKLFHNLLSNYQLPFSLSLTSAISMEETLKMLFEYSINKHFILILDDYQYMVKGEKKISSMIERLILKYQEQSKLMLILSCSSMNIVEKEFFSDKNMLSQIAAAKIHLKPFGFFECPKFFRNKSSIDLAYIYGIVGGVPEYLSLINERFSVEENIRNLFLNPSSYLFEQPSHLLMPEVREPSLYNAILSAIAGGASKLSEIAVEINEETSVCAAYLKNMLQMEIVQKETPVSENSAKKTIYRISDPLFRFWYYFLPDLLSDIYQRNTDSAYHQIAARLPEYMNDVFEDICREYLEMLSSSGKTPFAITEIGRWWGIDPFSRDRLNIPILAHGECGSMLFGSCKWSQDKMDLEEINALIQQSEFFSGETRYYYFFSRSGFTRSCQDASSKYPNITLVSFSK